MGQDLFLHGGLVTPPVIPAFVDQASRRADYSVFDRAGLSLLLIVLAMMSLGAGIRAMTHRIRTGAWPAMAFMGWPRLVAVVLISSLFPISLFVAYAHLTPLGQREYGLQPSYDRVVAEYAILITMVIVLVRILSTIALRRRGVEIGSAHLQSLRFDRTAITTGLAIAAAAVAYLVVWQLRIHSASAVAAAARRSILSSPTALWGVALAFLTLAYGICFGGAAAPPSSALGDRRRHRTSRAFLVMEIIVLAVLGAGLTVVVDTGHHFFSPALVRWVTNNLPWLGAGIALCVVVILGYGLLRRYFDSVWDADKNYTFSLSLSIAPPIVLTALVVALVAAPLLQWQERQAVARMTALHTGYDFTHELDNSPMRALQQELADTPP